MAPWELGGGLVKLVVVVEVEEMWWFLPKFGTEQIQFGDEYRIEIAQSWMEEAVGTVGVGHRK